MRVGQTLPFCIFWNNQAACKAGLRITQFGAPEYLFWDNATLMTQIGAAN